MLVSSPVPGHRAARRHVTFLYLGRRGLSRFALELAQTIAGMPDVRATFCISRQNEIYREFAGTGCRLLPVHTFETAGGALSRGYRARTLYRNLLGELTRQRSAGIVTLMPHIWTPLVAPHITRNGFRYLTIIHDARRHPGDPTGLLNGWMLRDAVSADPVVTLSRAVTEDLRAIGAVPGDKLVTLFHPDLKFEARAAVPARARRAGKFRLLFFGRILPYKGLPALLDALELLRAENFAVELGVFGEGTLGPLSGRLAALGAEVENRWIADHEVRGIFSRYDAVALPHTECSQSGVAATALGCGVPLVGSRVGGLAEQLRDGKTGVVAGTADALGLATAIRRLAGDHRLQAAIRSHIEESAWERSMRRFAERLVQLAVAGEGAQPSARPGNAA